MDNTFKTPREMWEHLLNGGYISAKHWEEGYFRMDEKGYILDEEAKRYALENEEHTNFIKYEKT